MANPVGHNKEHVPTAATRAVVRSNSGFGIEHDFIAADLGISPKTLRKHYAAEIAAGTPELVVRVAGRLFKKATAKNMDHAGVVAAIFLLKARGGYRDQHQKIEHANADGSAVGGTTNIVGPVQLFIPDNGRDPPPMKVIEGRALSRKVKALAAPEEDSN